MAAMKTSKKMKGGFMCHSAASTAVCKAAHDHRSVIVPRRSADRTGLMYDNSRLNNISATACTSTKYSRLVESPLFLPPANAMTKPISNGGDRHHRLSLQKPNSLPLLSAASSSDQVFQVVVMRVALHCQGCAGKLKKHLSKMQGVTSFSIDLETKRVTVMGHVSPVGVLESISKVKRAEFWP